MVLVAPGFSRLQRGLRWLPQAERLSQSMEKKIRMRLLLYLVVFFVCSIWGLVNRILQMTNTSTHQPPEQMEAMEAFFSPLQGFLNAIVYGLNVQVGCAPANWCLAWV